MPIIFSAVMTCCVLNSLVGLLPYFNQRNVAQNIILLFIGILFIHDSNAYFL